MIYMTEWWEKCMLVISLKVGSSLVCVLWGHNAHHNAFVSHAACWLTTIHKGPSSWLLLLMMIRRLPTEHHADTRQTLSSLYSLTLFTDRFIYDLCIIRKVAYIHQSKYRSQGLSGLSCLNLAHQLSTIFIYRCKSILPQIMLTK